MVEAAGEFTGKVMLITGGTEGIGLATAQRFARAGAHDEVVVVGDTIHDISAARACGATVVAVATGADPADTLRHADVVMATLHELPAWHTARFG